MYVYVSVYTPNRRHVNYKHLVLLSKIKRNKYLLSAINPNSENLKLKRVSGH